MVIDSANGVESQTRKLFEVCRRRRVPIFTMINKMDRPGKELLDLLGEIEEVLGIATVPLIRDDWSLRYTEERNPDVTFSRMPIRNAN